MDASNSARLPYLKRVRKTSRSAKSSRNRSLAHSWNLSLLSDEAHDSLGWELMVLLDLLDLGHHLANAGGQRQARGAGASRGRQKLVREITAMMGEKFVVNAAPSA